MIFKTSSNDTLIFWLKFELKLFMRTRRTQNILLGLILANLMWLYVIFSKGMELSFLQITYPLFLISISSFAYGQYFYSWHLPFLSIFFTNSISFKRYFIARILILQILMVFPSILPLILFRNSNENFFIILSSLVYLLGALPFQFVFWGINRTKKIDLFSKGFLANIEGKGRTHLLMEIPLFGVPLILLLILFLIKQEYILPYFMIAIGGIYLIFLFLGLNSHIGKFKEGKYTLLSKMRN